MIIYNKNYLCKWNCNHIREREQLFENLNNFIHGGFNLILDKNKEPLLHHFSWVRTKEEMIKKVQNWGHHNDKNWVELIEQEFSHSFNGTDFINHYQYDKIKNIFNLSLNEKPLFLYE